MVGIEKERKHAAAFFFWYI